MFFTRKLIKVLLLVNEIYMYKNTRCQDKKKSRILYWTAAPFSAYCDLKSLKQVFWEKMFVFISNKCRTCTEVFPSAGFMSPSINNCHNLKIPFQIYSCSVLMFNSPYADQMLVCFVPPCCKQGLNPCKVTLLRC